MIAIYINKWKTKGLVIILLLLEVVIGCIIYQDLLIPNLILKPRWENVECIKDFVDWFFNKTPFMLKCTDLSSEITPENAKRNFKKVL